MGQQQLLLVILVTIIIGISTVVAVNTFSRTAESANLDAVRNDLISLTALAKTYYLKPEVFGGGGNKFDNITFDGFAVPGSVSESGDKLTNGNGTYSIEVSNDSTLIINGIPSNTNNPTLQISNAGGDDIYDFQITEVGS